MKQPEHPDNDGKKDNNKTTKSGHHGYQSTRVALVSWQE
jgi:hypothetical protein